MKKLLVILVVLSVCVITFSCSSPESNGKKVAKKYCDCQQVYVEVEQKKLEITKKEYSKFVKEFDSYKFQNRLDFRNKVQEIETNIQQMHYETDKLYSECVQKAEEYYKKIDEKYATNKEKREKFNYARDNYSCAEVKSDNKESLYSDPEISALREQIKALRETVIPPKPNVERIKHDFFERTKKDFFIKEGGKKDFQIVNENNKGDEYVFEIRLVWQSKSDGEYDALVNMTYVLQQNDDWMINSVESNINIIKSGKYNNCITIQNLGSQQVSYGAWNNQSHYNVYRLEFTNNCNTPLVVVGAVLTNGKWQSFSTSVGGWMSGSWTGNMYFAKTSHFDFSYEIKDYKIHLVEQQ